MRARQQPGSPVSTEFTYSGITHDEIPNKVPNPALEPATPIVAVAGPASVPAPFQEILTMEPNSLGLRLDYARNCPLKQQLIYAILGFALSETMGLFCLMNIFFILFSM
ncbi:ATP synthase F(0) complex subunit C3, mitochondrial [Galemys pyrenaicus]|uniref:ATP synthase F(0) complex subunit C3, mitochondrial n=1 Tax=Galemys pyrenaicus TaxID=202257 RepID=A0A8J6AH31_GALPY|nr:ATP synthase F(0) complex subunit C3, mitochondrial [Galemys pyrenaicus]